MVVPRTDVRTVLDLRGGGVCEFFSEVRSIFFPHRCLRSMKRGMASARLVPMNC